MITMKVEYTIPGKTSLPEFALIIKFVISHKQRQIGHIFIWLFFIIFRRIIFRPQATKHPVHTQQSVYFTFPQFQKFHKSILRRSLPHNFAQYRDTHTHSLSLSLSVSKAVLVNLRTWREKFWKIYTSRAASRIVVRRLLPRKNWLIN